MQILPDVYLVGSGDFGFGLSHPKDCNVYLINSSNKLILIDTGVGIDNEIIITNIEGHGFSVENIEQIILTHGHADHAGGAKFFRDITGAKVLAHSNEANMISQADEEGLGLNIARRVGFYPKDYKFNACPIDEILEDGMKIQAGLCSLKVIWTPGHSKGSISLFGIINDKRVTFTSDAVSFNGYIILQNIPGADIHDYAFGVKKLSKLNTEVFLPGHMAFSLTRGQRHIDYAVKAFNNLGVPKSLL